MSRTFDYMVRAEPLQPPIGTFRFVAKVAYFYETTGPKDVAINTGIVEAIGTTEEEAKSKLTARLQEWIEDNKDQ